MLKLPSRMKNVIVLILIILGIVVVIHFLKIGPGVPPPQYLARLLIPEGDVSVQNCSQTNDTISTSRFVRTGRISDENSALFPELSRYSSHALYQSVTTNATMVISVWYFDNEREYSQAQEDLLTYLATEGTTNSAEILVDYPVLCEGNSASGETKIPGSDNKQRIRGTWYSGQSGSGIFLAISRPLMSERDDFFIQYYGMTEPYRQGNNSSEISDLIALNERPYSLKGTVGPLSSPAIHRA